MRTPLIRLAALALCTLALGACASLSDPATASRGLEPAKPAPPAPPTAATAVLRAPPSYPGGKTTATAPTGPAPSTLIRADGAGNPYTDLMDRIRAGFQLEDEDRTAIDNQTLWNARNPAYLDRVFGRAALYMHYIVEEIDKRGMPMELALLPVVESAFEPFAYSSARASGLWQFIPGTGNRFGLPQTWWYDGRRDVVESTRAALDYLQYLHDEFQGDWLLAIAGYNCGEGCVGRAVRNNLAAGKPITFWDLKLPAETRAYVPKLLAMKRVVRDTTLLGLEFSPIPNDAYFTRVDIEHQIDLKLAAELAGVTTDELFELNPAFHRWATPPQGPHSLLLPIDSAELFRQNLAQFTPDELMRVTHHIVAPGETLAGLAARYNTTDMTLRMLNGLAGNALIPGADLRVPNGSTELPAKVLRAAARVWSIAQRNNIDVNTLMRLNGKRPGQTILPGERLVVGNAATSGGRNNRAGRNNPVESGSVQRVTHTVRSGDTLSSIARRYGVTAGQIAAWNDIKVSGVLRPGQKLAIRTRRS
ncbi:MAG: LysM peptidoglycan-binding domain-containing protein [Xanthomonadales bacterium]|nr:LysM peptidoglycan-binding domain-containing protein [Xanthomonadales bacterium]